jgi:LmbE family N-acetylglucosaminyl deacetylase
MQATIVDDIITKKKVCYFISPHYDDMIFSAGGLATKLTKTNKIVVVNVFTTAGHRHTLSAKAYLGQCNYSDAAELYQDRAKEDKDALAAVADEVIDLGFNEALWRKKSGLVAKLFGKILPEFDSIYPTYRFHIIKGRVAKADRPTVTAIETKLKEIVSLDNAVVFCPLGIGNHIDHVITHLACKESFPHPIYWADYPYTQNSDTNTKMNSFKYDGHMTEKTKLVAKYKTQYQAMFGASGLALEPERFYLSELSYGRSCA